MSASDAYNYSQQNKQIIYNRQLRDLNSVVLNKISESIANGLTECCVALGELDGELDDSYYRNDVVDFLEGSLREK